MCVREVKHEVNLFNCRCFVVLRHSSPRIVENKKMDSVIVGAL